MSKTSDTKPDYNVQLGRIVAYMIAEQWDFEATQHGVSLDLFDGRVTFNSDGTFTYHE